MRVNTSKSQRLSGANQVEGLPPARQFTTPLRNNVIRAVNRQPGFDH